MLLKREFLFLICLLINNGCWGFEVPDVTLEAFKPKGFKASVPDVKGLQMFAFHGNLNKDITHSEPGEYSNDITEPDAGQRWAYYNPEITLKPGDVIYFWVFMQYDNLGFRNDKKAWTVSELLTLNETCDKTSPSTVSGKSVVCSGTVVFHEDFKQDEINRKSWTIEQYIPFNDPSYDFVSYQDKPQVCFIKDKNFLFIKPEATLTLQEKLDLKGKCSRETDDECYQETQAAIIVPPIVSGKLVSAMRFQYGIIEIKAKLPAGDWMYPLIYLEHSYRPDRRILIAYARGNDKLTSTANEDIGGRLLFAGPSTTDREPQKSQYLSTVKAATPYTNDMHIYKVKWTKDEITVFCDGVEYGKMNARNIGMDSLARVVLGVGVGGATNFPDNYKSGSYVKPWKNSEPAQMWKFFQARNSWFNTWKGDDAALQIDYVKITAL